MTQAAVVNEYDRSDRTPCTNHLQKICGLNIVQVREIRKKLLNKDVTIAGLAQEYEVEFKAITNVRDKRIFGNAK